MSDGNVTHLSRRQRRRARWWTTRPTVPEEWLCSTRCTRSRPTTPRSRGALELQGGQVRLVLGRDQRQAAADVHDRLNELDLDEADHDRADAHVPARAGSGDRRVVEFRVKKKIQPFTPQRARGGRRHLAHAAGRRGPRAGIPQVHRVLPVPGRLPRAARSSEAREFVGPRFLVHVAASRCTRSIPATAPAELKEAHGIGYCNITKCCTKVCPERITHHGQRDHSAQGTGGGSVLRSAQGAGETRTRQEGGNNVRTQAADIGGSSCRARKRRAVSLAQRAVGGGEHLLRHRRGGSRAPGSPAHRLLAHTDQFGHDTGAVRRAREALAKLTDRYERAYYAGLICERLAKAQLDHRAPGARFDAYDELREAMEWYEKAEAIRPAGDDDAILRWNTCARMLNQSPHIVPRSEEMREPVIGE